VLVKIGFLCGWTELDLVGLLIYIFMLIFGFDLVCVLVVKILIGFGVNHMKFEYTLRGILGCWICKFDVDFLFRKYWAIVGIYIL
jgi:hypothetical protein